MQKYISKLILLLFLCFTVTSVSAITYTGESTGTIDEVVEWHVDTKPWENLVSRINNPTEVRDSYGYGSFDCYTISVPKPVGTISYSKSDYFGANAKPTFASDGQKLHVMPYNGTGVYSFNNSDARPVNCVENKYFAFKVEKHGVIYGASSYGEDYVIGRATQIKENWVDALRTAFPTTVLYNTITPAGMTFATKRYTSFSEFLGPETSFVSCTFNFKKPKWSHVKSSQTVGVRALQGGHDINGGYCIDLLTDTEAKFYYTYSDTVTYTNQVADI